VKINPAIGCAGRGEKERKERDIPLNVVKLVKGKRGRKHDVPFSEACPHLIQDELDLQAP
jgi:hypothetical protein